MFEVMGPLVARFNRYRFDYASLVFDSGRAFFSDEYRTGARIVAAPLLLFMLCPPAVTLLIGLNPFGDAYAFAVMLIAWPWVLEMPAWSVRQLRASPALTAPIARAPGFDWFIHAFFCAVALVAIVAVGFKAHHLEAIGARGDLLLGLAWAIALAGSTDLARSLVALFLARLHGFPLYGPNSRKSA
jgi:hypothetical protein